MNKNRKLILALILVFCLPMMLTGCKSKEVGIKVSGIPKTVLVGETLNTDNVVVEVVYKDESTEVLDKKDYTITTLDTTTAGEKTITVTYKKFTQDIKVNVVGVKDIKVSGVNDYVLVGETMDFTGAIVEVTFTDNSKMEINSSEVTFTQPDTTEIGESSYTVTYKDKVVTKTINVIDITNVEIQNTTKIEKYSELDITGKIVIVTYSNGKTENITSADITITKPDTTIAGETTFTINYKERTFTQNILVFEIVKIELNGSIPNVKYGSDGVVNYDYVSGFVVRYSDGTSKTISLAEITSKKEVVDTTVSGAVSLEITYKYYTETSITIIVTDKPFIESITNIAGYEKVIKLNDTFTLDNLTALVNYSENEIASKPVTAEDFNITGEVNTNVAGVYTITLTYNETDYDPYTTTIAIKVLGVKKIELIGEYTTGVVIGRDFDLSLVTGANIFYGDDVDEMQETVPYIELDIGNISTATSGIQHLTITYKDHTEIIDIIVYGVKDIKLDGELKNIEIQDIFYIDYIENAIITYENDETEIIPFSSLLIGTIDTMEAGEKTLIISYKEFEKEFTITVLGFVSLELQGTIDTEVRLNQDIDFGGVTGFLLTYTDESTRLLSLDEVTISGIDTSSLGQKQLEFSYKNLVYFTLDYEVVGLNVIYFDIPETLTAYDSNKIYTDSDASFSIANRDYLVGTDNVFTLAPKIVILNNESEPATIDEIDTEIVIEISDNNEHFSPLAETELYIDYIGSKNVNIKFNSNAVGKYFRINVNALGNADAGSFSFSFRVVNGMNIYNAKDLSILDNFNAAWNNFRTENNIEYTGVLPERIILHDEIHITANDIPSELIWQPGEPTQQGLDERIVGSLKELSNSTYIYDIRLKTDDDFEIQGNYFTINASEIPLVRCSSSNEYVLAKVYGDEDEHMITAHSSLFNFGSDDNSTDSVYTIENVAFVGNGQRSEEAQYSGSLIIFKSNSSIMNIDNTSFQRFYIGYMFQNINNYVTINNKKYFITDSTNEYYTFTADSVKYYISKADSLVYNSSSLTERVFTESTIEITLPANIINNTKGFECFNSHLYLWGSRVEIINSSLKSAGGPVMIVDHVASSNSDEKLNGINGKPSYVYATNCVLESYISGSEPWFATYGATDIVSSIQSVDPYYNIANPVISQLESQRASLIPFIQQKFGCNAETANDIFDEQIIERSKSTLKTNDAIPKINLIAVYKSGSAEGLTTLKVRGEIKITERFTEHKSLDLGGKHYQTITSYQKQGFIMENSYNGLVFDTVSQNMETNINNYLGLVDDYFESCTTKIDYIRTFLNVYLFNGMGAMIELFNANN